jgi:hypothetical protein
MSAVQSIKRVVPPDPLNTSVRLGELAKLEDGWLDGKGRAPAKERCPGSRAILRHSLEPLKTLHLDALMGR